MFQNNKINLVLSIIAAIVLWSYVMLEVNPNDDRTIRDIPVSIKNLDNLEERDLTIVENETYTVDVKISGPRSEIMQVSSGDIDATVDVHGYPKGKHNIKVVVTVPDGVRSESVTPDTISVDIEEYVTESKDIKISFDGTFAENTEPGFISIVPEEIELSGAKTLVESVSHISAVVKSSDVKDEESTLTVSALPVDDNGDEVEGLNMSRDTVDVTSTLLYKKTVPLNVNITGSVASEYEVTAQRIPTEITLRGIKSELDKITEINARNVNISDITETTEIPLRFSLPDKVEIAEESEGISVVIEISGISVKELNISTADIELRNVRRGFNTEIDRGTINIKIYGNEDVISDFDENDLTLYIDMSGADYTLSSYEGTIRYTDNDTISRITVDPAKIQVRINETE